MNKVKSKYGVNLHYRLIIFFFFLYNYINAFANYKILKIIIILIDL